MGYKTHFALHPFSVFGRFAMAVAATVIIAIIQDAVITLWEHERFATSAICADMPTRLSMGRYADEHCRAHLELANWYRVSAWLNAFYEGNVHRIAAAIAGVLWVL